MPEKNNRFYLTNDFNFDFPGVTQTGLRIYHRNLPHFERDGAFYFVTFRLANSIPISIIRQIREEFEQQKNADIRQHGSISSKRLYHLRFNVIQKIDDYLDNNINIRYLGQPAIADLVLKSILYFSVIYHADASGFLRVPTVEVINSYSDLKEIEIRFILYRWIILPNHVHLLMRPLADPVTGKYFQLHRILQSIKSFSGRQANIILKRKGQFWQPESYDHIVRNQTELNRIWKYIDYNAVKAGLADAGSKWRWESDYWFEHLH